MDVGALSPQLFESELFGHRRGAFTDAKEDRIGLFRAASGGTLFLDEIGNVPLHLQSKLLTALERHEVVPVGANRPEPIDVRLVCATNLAPEQLADANRFREDLLYRINTVEILLPPLRERREDIPLLLEHFIALYAQKYNFPAKRLSAAALRGADGPRLARQRARAAPRGGTGGHLQRRSGIRARGLLPRRSAPAPGGEPRAGCLHASMPWKRAPLPGPSTNIRAMSVAPRRRSVSRGLLCIGARRSMGFSRFRAGIALRTAALFLTLLAVAEMIARTQWYMTIALCVAAALCRGGAADTVRDAIQP